MIIIFLKAIYTSKGFLEADQDAFLCTGKNQSVFMHHAGNSDASGLISGKSIYVTSLRYCERWR